MNAEEIVQELNAIKDEIGPKAYVSIDISTSWGGMYGTIYPDGIANCEAIRTEKVSTIQECIAAIRAMWADHRAKFYADTIRKMALEIVDLTHRNGTCERAALRLKFSDKIIDQLGEDACALAGEMAAGAPFSITERGRSNQPPELEVAA